VSSSCFDVKTKWEPLGYGSDPEGIHENHKIGHVCCETTRFFGVVGLVNISIFETEKLRL
jgi:hypothetical protein